MLAMDSNIPELAPKPTPRPKLAEHGVKEVRISFKLSGRAREELKVVYEPGNPCCIMPKAYLEAIEGLDEMEPAPATHDSHSRPHKRVGILETRIRIAEDLGNNPIPGDTSPVTFCIVEDINSEQSSICIGGGMVPLAALPTCEPRPGTGRPVRPILTGRKTQGCRCHVSSITCIGADCVQTTKKSQDAKLKRKKDDDDDKEEEKGDKRKKRREEEKNEKAQPGKDTGKQSK